MSYFNKLLIQILTKIWKVQKYFGDKLYKLYNLSLKILEWSIPRKSFTVSNIDSSSLWLMLFQAKRFGYFWRNQISTSTFLPIITLASFVAIATLFFGNILHVIHFILIRSEVVTTINCYLTTINKIRYLLYLKTLIVKLYL
jgi:hypothetical protein